MHNNNYIKANILLSQSSTFSKQQLVRQTLVFVYFSEVSFFVFDRDNYQVIYLFFLIVAVVPVRRGNFLDMAYYSGDVNY